MHAYCEDISFTAAMSSPNDKSFRHLTNRSPESQVLRSNVFGSTNVTFELIILFFHFLSDL